MPCPPMDPKCIHASPDGSLLQTVRFFVCVGFFSVFFSCAFLSRMMPLDLHVSSICKRLRNLGVIIELRLYGAREQIQAKPPLAKKLAGHLAKLVLDLHGYNIQESKSENDKITPQGNELKESTS